MRKDQLSNRLQTVAGYVRSGDVIADIGTDHGYLAVFLLEMGISPYAILGDVNEGPLSSAAEQVNLAGLQERTSVKLGNGLDVLEGESVDTVIIAGMGGPLIAQILNNGEKRFSNVRRLILQPNVAADHIRLWLYTHGWELIDEKIIEEDGHIYEVITAEKGDPAKHYDGMAQDKQLWLGPILLKEPNDAFKKKWNRELHQLKKIRTRLDETAVVENTLDKRREVEKKIQWLKEEL